MPDITLTRARPDTQGWRLQDYLRVRVVKGFLQNLDNGRTTEFLFNPAEFRETYRAKYARLGSTGLSHERLQFTGNRNTQIPLELIFDQIVFRERRAEARRPRDVGLGAANRQALNEVDQVRRNLLETIYPRRATRLASASPPPVLFHWPGMISMRVRVMEVAFSHRMFETITPLPRIMVAEVLLEEEPMERIFSEQIRRSGTIRPWAASDRPRRRGS